LLRPLVVRNVVTDQLEVRIARWRTSLFKARGGEEEERAADPGPQARYLACSLTTVQCPVSLPRRSLLYIHPRQCGIEQRVAARSIRTVCGTVRIGYSGGRAWGTRVSRRVG